MQFLYQGYSQVGGTNLILLCWTTLVLSFLTTLSLVLYLLLSMKPPTEKASRFSKFLLVAIIHYYRYVAMLLS